jgi:phosphoenolpyruvate-protein kinase (PTS system EI component)
MNPEERALLIAEITEAVKVIPTVLSDDEQRWVRLAIKKEAQSIAFRTAIIEKSLLGVVAMFGAGVIYIIADFLKNHGFK